MKLGCGLELGAIRFWAHVHFSYYPYLSLYCCVQPWRGATLGVHVAWFGFAAGWEPSDQGEDGL